MPSTEIPLHDPDVHTPDWQIGKGAVVVYSATCVVVKGPAMVPGWQSPPPGQAFARLGVANNVTTKIQLFMCMFSSLRTGILLW
jgi:hypothetical protein